MLTDHGLGSLADDVTLTESLALVVPLHIEELLALHGGALAPLRIFKDAGSAIAYFGDFLMFRSRGEPTARQREKSTLAFNGLARGLAALAFVPGGASFAGLHWCLVEHPDCPRSAMSSNPAPDRASLVAAFDDLCDDYERLLRRRIPA